MCRREWRREKKVERECFSDHVDDNIHFSGIHNYILDAWLKQRIVSNSIQQDIALKKASAT